MVGKPKRKKKYDKNWGGRRKGAGGVLKYNQPLIPTTIRLTEDDRAFLKSLNGDRSEAVRQLIARARAKS